MRCNLAPGCISSDVKLCQRKPLFPFFRTPFFGFFLFFLSPAKLARLKCNLSKLQAYLGSLFCSLTPARSLASELQLRSSASKTASQTACASCPCPSTVNAATLWSGRPSESSTTVHTRPGPGGRDGEPPGLLSSAVGARLHPLRRCPGRLNAMRHSARETPIYLSPPRRAYKAVHMAQRNRSARLSRLLPATSPSAAAATRHPRRSRAM